MTCPQRPHLAPAARALGLALALGGAACASSRAVPHELADARTALRRATAGPASSLTPVPVHLAQLALERAERAWRRDPGGTSARDLGYVAERQAQLAESLAGSALAREQQAQAERTYSRQQAAASRQAASELKGAQLQLARARGAARAALTQLDGLRDAVKEDERGLVITLSGAVLFASNEAALLPSAQAQLDGIARAIGQVHRGEVVVEGHTDASGSQATNSSLAQRRAQSVADYLSQRGLAGALLRAVGIGPDRPVADNASPEGRAANRRVEIVVRGEGATAS